MPAALNSTIFWDTMVCSPVEVHWHFRVMHCLRLQGWRVNQASKSKVLFLGLFFNPKDAGMCSCKTVNLCHIPEQNPSWALLFLAKFWYYAPVGKRNGCSLSSRSPAPIADSSNVATMARKHSVLNLWEINKNNKHTALASVWTYYGWVSLIF
jgi:hypothetical protein